ncbi:hypothetical protein JOF53_002387 [Crossiella equi]|uniref:Sugar 3,4-ketoisomerase QdtA cupin domain-containing protein n=1 Tax=Crossiella equi TaxID=130796 RepID=A0ABS5ACT6_9PSEU|nr:FdtA/QdtA family cupin domain-containing protein [Crossiella equi]MBP2473515.1 hypothetical protein [Crossiella equi]
MTAAPEVVVGRVDPCRLVDIPRHDDARGSLCVVEEGAQLPFPVRRAYYMFDIPDGASRGAHGHRRLRQLIIAVHGSFDVLVDDGFHSHKYTLDSPSKGLYIGPMVWRDMVGFAPGTVGLWLVADLYDPAEYYRDHAEFLRDARALP